MGIYYDYETRDGYLKVVASIEDENLSYEFHIIAVWRDSRTNKLYWGEDSGCSCPSPFEDCSSEADLNPLNKASWDEFVTRVENLNGKSISSSDFVNQFKAEVESNG